MQRHMFDFLIEEIEPEERQTWPPTMREVLHTFRVEDSFGTSQEYQAFLDDFDNQARPRKRRRTAEDALHAQPVHVELSLTKDPITRAPDTVSLTGEVYKLTVENNQAVAHSDQIGGQILLTVPFAIQASPFIMIPITTK